MGGERVAGRGQRAIVYEIIMTSFAGAGCKGAEASVAGI